MTFILSILNSPLLLSLIGGAVLAIAAFLKGSKSGKDKERAKQLKRDAQVRRQNDGIINEAAKARAAAADDDLLSDDGHRRD